MVGMDRNRLRQELVRMGAAKRRTFADSVVHDRPVAIPVSESIANMTVLDRIREAARI